MQLTINLASRRYLNRRLFQLIFWVLVLLLSGIITWQISSFLAARQQEQEYRSHLQALQEQLTGKRPEQQSAVGLAQQQAAYDRAAILLQQDAFRWTLLFDRMEQLLPTGISLRSFNPDYEKNALVLTGVARDLSRLQALLDNLHGADFQHAYLITQGEVQVNDGRGGKRTALSFSINLAGVF